MPLLLLLPWVMDVCILGPGKEPHPRNPQLLPPHCLPSNSHQLSVLRLQGEGTAAPGLPPHPSWRGWGLGATRMDTHSR